MVKFCQLSAIGSILGNDAIIPVPSTNPEENSTLPLNSPILNLSSGESGSPNPSASSSPSVRSSGVDPSIKEPTSKVQKDNLLNDLTKDLWASKADETTENLPTIPNEERLY